MKYFICFITFIYSFGLSARDIDHQILHDINHINNRFIHNSSNFLSNSTPYIAAGIPVAMGVYSLITKDNTLFLDAFYVGSSLCEAVAISYGLKYVVQRDRPFKKHGDIIQRDKVGKYSFPSSHTSSAFAVATSLSIRYPKWYVIAPSMLWASGVGFARIYEGVHYPSDVLCGAVLGAGTAWLNYKLNQWLIKKYEPKLKFF